MDATNFFGLRLAVFSLRERLPEFELERHAREVEVVLDELDRLEAMVGEEAVDVQC